MSEERRGTERQRRRSWDGRSRHGREKGDACPSLEHFLFSLNESAKRDKENAVKVRHVNK